MITVTIIICVSVLLSLLLSLATISKLLDKGIDTYKTIHTPLPPPPPQTVHPDVKRELDDIKGKLSGIEMMKGMRKL